MIKLILTLAFFCLLVATINPTPTAKELTKIVGINCKDICK